MKHKMELLFWDYPKGLGFEWVMELRPSTGEVSLRCVGYPEGDRRCFLTFSKDSNIEIIKAVMLSVGFTQPEVVTNG